LLEIDVIAGDCVALGTVLAGNRYERVGGKELGESATGKCEDVRGHLASLDVGSAVEVGIGVDQTAVLFDLSLDVAG
jgi:hypothetical protein